MPRWADEAANQLDQDLQDGEISSHEHDMQMADIQDEVRRGAEDAADQARNDYYNH